MDRMHTSPSHLRTLDARTQSVLRDDVFVSVFKMNSEDSLDEVIGGLCMLLVQIPMLPRFTFLDQAIYFIIAACHGTISHLFHMLFFSGFRCIYLRALQCFMSL